MAAFNGWAVSLLRSLGAPVTKENLRFLDAWQRAEGGSASFNPLNTTQPFHGSTNYNSVGVKNYGTPHAGVLATKKTLLNGHYNDIVNLLKSGHASAGQMATAVSQSPWGTGGGVLRVLGESPQAAPPKRGGIQEPPKVPQPSVTGALDNWKQMLGSYFAGNAAQLAAGQMPNTGALMQLAQMRQAIGLAQGQEQVAKTQFVSDHGGPLSPNAPGIVKLAKQYLGTKYVWGGSNPKSGFDCSGFVQWLYAQKGIKLPRTTYDQVNVGQHVGAKQLRPGDIVFFSKHGDVHHEGMYIGHGQFIHAPHTGDVVKISSLSDPYYASQFIGGRRVA